MFRNPEGQGSIPRLGSRRSSLISIEHAELLRSTPSLELCLASIAGAVSETWFALGVQAPNYIFVIREQYQTKPDICTSLISKKKFFLVFIMSFYGVLTHISYFFACNF